MHHTQFYAKQESLGDICHIKVCQLLVPSSGKFSSKSKGHILRLPYFEPYLHAHMKEIFANLFIVTIIPGFQQLFRPGRLIEQDA